MECHACGAELDPRDKFCSKCGAVTERGKGASELAGRYVAELADGFGKLFAAALGYVTNPENRKKVAIGGGVALVLFISLTSNPISRGVGGLFSSVPDGPTYNDNGTPNFAEYEDVFLAERASYDVTGQANVRDFPTGEGTNVIGTLVAGETVEAQEVMAFDPLSRWLKLASGGYVWGANLSPIGPAPEPRLPMFPPRFQGSWSTRESCDRNGADIFVDIGPTTIFVQGNRSDLLRTIEDDSSLTLYVIRPTANPDTEMQITIDYSANGRWIILNYKEPEDIGVWSLHDPEMPCHLLYR